MLCSTSTTVRRNLLRNLDGGVTVLLHDSDAYSSRGSWRATAEAVPRVLEVAAARGLTPAGSGQSGL